ncbi:hypothetical protein Droror1_Dr00024362 [Drosera rotundifolia]
MVLLLQKLVRGVSRPSLRNEQSIYAIFLHCHLLSFHTSVRRNRTILMDWSQGPLFDSCLLAVFILGGNTIFKQVRNLNNVCLSKEEHEDIKFMIQRNLYGYLAVLLEGREQFEEEILTEMRKRRADQPSSSRATTCNDLERERKQTRKHELGTFLGEETRLRW